MYYTRTRTLLLYFVAILLMLAVVVTEPCIHAKANERLRTLGKDTLGETVKEFLIRYPKAICGRLISLEINPQNLVNSGSMRDIHCCLNDRDSLTKMSPFRILNLDDCAVHATFWKSRLDSLTYMVDVRSVQIVLDPFEKLYGPPAQMMKDPQDANNLILVDWMEGMTTLELKLSRLGREVSSKDSTQTKGESWLQVVSVSLWNSDLGTA
jgi:hypothetical protein